MMLVILSKEELREEVGEKNLEFSLSEIARKDEKNLGFDLRGE